MAHDLFISYSNKDKPIADGICANLEAAGIRCWIAPRDIAAGEDWPTAITTAISNSKVMVLVFSASSNSSSDVSREIILAANENLTIIPFKIEDVKPEPGKQYYLARTHWLEAMNPPTREQIQVLVDRVRALVPAVGAEGFVQSAFIPVPSSMPPFTAQKRPSRWRYLWLAIILVLVALGFTFWPKNQGMPASPTETPTLGATDTLIPTSTYIATATQTESLVPKTTPTTGTVTGFVRWGEQPYAGVSILLCSDQVWDGKCDGLQYTVVSDSQGAFSINKVEPGKYTLVSNTPEDLGLNFENYGQEIQVFAGGTLNLDPIEQCKFTLTVYTPVVQNGRVTLHWSSYPSDEYSWYVGDVYGSDNSEQGSHIHNRTITTRRSFASGTYVYSVSADSYDGVGPICGIGWFTIP